MSQIIHERFWFFSCCRPCVRFAWIVWKTWSSCADTAPAKCAATGCRSVQYVARRSTSAFCSTKNKRQSHRPPLRAGIFRRQLSIRQTNRTTARTKEWIIICNRSRQFAKRKADRFFISHLLFSDRIIMPDRIEKHHCFPL